MIWKPLLAIAALAAVCWALAQDVFTLPTHQPISLGGPSIADIPSPPPVVMLADENGAYRGYSKAEAISKLAKSGDICAVLGHHSGTKWEQTKPEHEFEGYLGTTTLEYRPPPKVPAEGTQTRTCYACGKTETRQLTDWK